ncbi:Uncharacterised protein [Vibrio cholerae]|nr:Uncharacterised protein [Vibrio cholerae]
MVAEWCLVRYASLAKYQRWRQQYLTLASIELVWSLPSPKHTRK